MSSTGVWGIVNIGYHVWMKKLDLRKAFSYIQKDKQVPNLMEWL